MLTEVISIFIEILQAIISSTSRTFTFVFFKLVKLYSVIVARSDAVSPAEIFITLFILFIIGAILFRFFISSIKTLLLFLFLLGIIVVVLFTLYILLWI